MDSVAEGKITVAPTVLLDIIEQAALYTDGVLGMAAAPPRVDRLFRKLMTREGIELGIKEDSIVIDLFLNVGAVDILKLSHRVQREVIRSMDKLIGLNVEAVNIHIEDVVYPTSDAS